MVQHGRSSRSSWAKSVRSSFGKTIMGKGIRESSIRTRTTLVCVCGRYKTGWKETKHWPNVESTCERSRFWRTNILPWPRLFHLYSTRMSNKQKKWTITEVCLNPKSLLELQKSYLIPRNLAQPFPHGPKIWKEMCGKILRTGEQNNSTTKRSRDTMHWRPPLQGRRNGINWRIVKSMLTKCSEMPVFGSHW